MSKTLKIRFINIALFVAMGIMFTTLFLLSPSPSGIGTHEQIFKIPCLFKLVLQHPCPSCGLTTSLTYLAHLDISSSFKTHPLGPLFALSFIAILVLSLTGAIKATRWWAILEKRWFQNTILCGIGLYLVIWIIRLLTNSF